MVLTRHGIEMTSGMFPKDNAPQHIAAPFLTTVMQIEPQWIDYNGHLNMAYYNVLFDRGIDQMWLELGIGPQYMKERHCSTFTAEAHVRYLREVHLGDPVQVSVYLIAADEKRRAPAEEDESDDETGNRPAHLQRQAAGTLACSIRL